MVERRWRAMASPVTWLVAVEAEPAWIDEHAAELAAGFAAVEASLSRFRPDSELTVLNQAVGRPVAVSPLLYTALSLAYRAWRVSGGRFDPRVIDALERLGYRGAPRAGAGPASFPPGTGPWLRRHPRTHRVVLAGPVDLGGIGKSLAVWQGVRRLTRFLQARGVTPPPMLLNAGGDLAMVGPATPRPHGWRVGVEHPGDPAALAAVLEFGEASAVCTSSVARRRWIHEGRWVHHLIDPATQQPGGAGLLSVTVAHPRPTWAEVWSKVLFLAGADRIAHEAATRGLKAWWVTAAGTFHATPRAARHVRWVHPELAGPLSAPPP